VWGNARKKLWGIARRLEGPKRDTSMTDHIRRRLHMPRLQGKNALVTGASSGIGQAIAIRFAEEGANVAINYRGDAEGAEATRAAAAKAGGKHVLVQADISSEDEVKTMFGQTLEA